MSMLYSSKLSSETTESCFLWEYKSLVFLLLLHFVLILTESLLSSAIDSDSSSELILAANCLALTTYFQALRSSSLMFHYAILSS